MIVIRVDEMIYKQHHSPEDSTLCLYIPDTSTYFSGFQFPSNDNNNSYYICMSLIVLRVINLRLVLEIIIVYDMLNTSMHFELEI